MREREKNTDRKMRAYVEAAIGVEDGEEEGKKEKDETTSMDES